METSTFDTGTIVILAAVLLVGCMAIKSWIGSQKLQSVPQGEELVPMRDELRNANASLSQLTTIVQQQQAAIDKNTQTLEGVRRALEDQADAGRTALESVSGAIDTARSEATARNEAMRKLLGDVHGVAAAASENAENALLTAGGLRRKLDEVGAQAKNIPPLRNDIHQLQQSVTAIAEAMPKNAEQPPTPGNDDQPKPGRERKTPTNGRRTRKTARKTATKQTRRGRETPPGEETPTAAEPPETDAPASADSGAQDSGTPPAKPPTATAAPDPDAMKPATPEGDSAPSSQTAAADAASGTNGKPAPAAPPAAGNATAEARNTADESADEAADAAGNDTTATGAGALDTAADDAGETPPADTGTA